jgi:hypothetical protein
MNKIASIVFVVAIALPLLWKTGVVLDYLADYANYLEQCENKNQPELQCNGKCQLTKELNRIDRINPEQPELPSAVTHDEGPLFFFPSPLAISASNEVSKSDVFVYVQNYNHLIVHELLEPPRF